MIKENKINDLIKKYTARHDAFIEKNKATLEAIDIYKSKIKKLTDDSDALGDEMDTISEFLTDLKGDSSV